MTRLYFAFASREVAETHNVIPLTAERHRQPSRGNTTEQFKSVWMKFNPHSSPPPVCRLIYSQVHLAAVSGGSAVNQAGEHTSIQTVFQWLCFCPAHF